MVNKKNIMLTFLASVGLVTIIFLLNSSLLWSSSFDSALDQTLIFPAKDWIIEHDKLDDQTILHVPGSNFKMIIFQKIAPVNYHLEDENTILESHLDHLVEEYFETYSIHYESIGETQTTDINSCNALYRDFEAPTQNANAAKHNNYLWNRQYVLACSKNSYLIFASAHYFEFEELIEVTEENIKKFQ